MRNLKLCILLFGLFVTLGLRAQNANAQSTLVGFDEKFMTRNAQPIDTIAPIATIDSLNSQFSTLNPQLSTLNSQL